MLTRQESRLGIAVPWTYETHDVHRRGLAAGHDKDVMCFPRRAVRVALPCRLRQAVRARYGTTPGAFDLKLKDGTILRDIAIDATGAIGGAIVGLRDGAIPLADPPSEHEIVAVRVVEGILGTFRLRPWITLPLDDPSTTHS